MRTADSQTPAIELTDVRKVFELPGGEKVTALDGVSLTVARGEFVCLVGPSGHGKTTLLNVVAGFVQPNEGTVLAAGEPVVGPGPDRGVVFQRDTVFPWRRVADNIGFGLRARGVPKKERERIVREHLCMVGLERYAHAWPKQLSGGMRRRAAIAAVFANDPDVLLMDEPFVGLDHVRRATLYEVLLNLWQRSQRTVLFITHDIDEALALADRIVVMVGGNAIKELSLTAERPRSVASLASDEMNAARAEIMFALDRGVNGA
ncbi:MAG: ABC transporter ATP-binding protein [Solirubrobacteraceae bacterium]